MLSQQAFRVGDAIVEVDADDVALRQRFDEIYGECAVAVPAAEERTLPTVRLTTRETRGQVHATFDGAPPIAIGPFIDAIFPGRGFETATVNGAQVVRVRMPGNGGDATFSADGATMDAGSTSDWRPLVANVAVARAIAMQQALLFFHAASARVHGRALIACGPKQSGKTTLGLALGVRGHGLYGDELAALRLDSGELVAVRRSLSVREGVASVRAAEALARLHAVRERYPDGEWRTRTSVTSVTGDGPPPPAPLSAIFLLRRFASRPSADLVPPSPAVVAALTPLGASMWGRAPGALLMTMLRQLARTRIFQLDAGPPDDTAALVEHLMETA